MKDAMINMQNYEAYLLDYLEHMLDDRTTNELFIFLNKHKELKNELISCTNLKLPKLHIGYSEKESLKKLDFTISSINSSNFNDFCIAFYERILDDRGIELLGKYLVDHPNKIYEFKIFEKTYLKSDNNITYYNKSLLKRKYLFGYIFKSHLLQWSAIAAMIFITISLFTKINSVKEISTIINKHPKNIDIITKKEINTKSLQIASKIGSLKRGFDKNPKLKGSKIFITHDTLFREKTGNRIESIGFYKINSEYASIYPSPSKVVLNKDSFTEDKNMDVIEYVQYKVKNNLLNVQKVTGLDQKISFWNLAQFTLKNYNKLTENKINIYRKQDENGKTVALAIQTEDNAFGFTTKNK
jgi:hypothetical protein